MSKENIIMKEYPDGRKFWYKAGKLHRDNDLPAIERVRGVIKEWYKNGEQHRDGDKPAIECADGYKEWRKEGKRYYP